MIPTGTEQKDLIILVADIQQEKTISELLDTRCESLHVRKPNYEIYRHSEHDPGIYKGAGKFLSIFVNQFRYALVCLDADWEGSSGLANEISQKIQKDLAENSWQNRSAVVVIDPELEIWVWSDSPHVPRVLGTDWKRIRAIAYERDYWRTDKPKPHKPKELLEDVLLESNKRRSAALFEQLARTVGLERCQDTSFATLRLALQEWFPPQPDRAIRERRASYRQRKTR